MKRLPLYRAVLCVLVFGGLRPQECLDLHVTDFDTEGGGLLVRCCKGRKQRPVFLSPVVQEALSAWIAVRPVSDLPYLFLWDRSKRVSQSALARIVEEAERRRKSEPLTVFYVFIHLSPFCRLVTYHTL